MSISSVGSSALSTYVPQTPQTASQATANQTATQQPDTDASTPATPAVSGAPATPLPGARTNSTSSTGTQAAAPADAFKINPDGTVGRLHLPRHPNAPGVVHA